MDHLELLKCLGNELEKVKKYFKNIDKYILYDYSDKLEKLTKSYDELSEYCKNVGENQRSLSEIYHAELLELFRVIEEVKISSNNFKNYKLDLDEYYLVRHDSDNEMEIINHLTKLETALEKFALIEGLKEEIPEAAKEELKKYVDKGRYLKDCSLTLKLKDELANLKIPESSSYYCALIGPHLLGKTQTSFTLSHLMDVIHINLVMLFPGKNAHDIDLVTKSLSKLFLNAIREDFFATECSRFGNGVWVFLLDKVVNKRLQTLGLIYTILKLKNMNIPEFEDQEKLYSYFSTMKSVLVQPLSQTEFKLKMQENGFILENTLIFIDGLNDLNDGLFFITFIRSLCEVVDLPIILAGTDPKITDLSHSHRRNTNPRWEDELYPWVKVVAKTPNDPKCFLKCLGCSIDVKHDNEVVKLDKYIENDQLNFDLLVTDLIGINEDSLQVKAVLEFLFEQLKTNLPGLVTECIKITLSKLSAYKEEPFDLKSLWPKILKKTTKFLCKKNKSMLYKESLILTSILAGGTVEFNRLSLEDCATFVEGHYCFYGFSSEPIFDIYVENNSKSPSLIKKKGSEYRHPVHFPDLEEDFLMNICCTNTWFRDLDATGRVRGTLAEYYAAHLYSQLTFPIDSKKDIKNHYAIKNLALWTVSLGSHLSKTGNAKALEAIEHFVRNIQSIKLPHGETGIDFKPLVVPDGLKMFLERIEIPYLLTDTKKHDEIVKRVSGFMTMGDCELKPKNLSWDVTFDAKIIGETGFKKCHIDCKLWTKSAGIPAVYKYYEKACKDASPVTIIIVKGFTKSLQSSDVLENINTISMESDSDSDNEESAKKKVKRDYIGLLGTLWENQSNNVNIYTIKFDKSDFSFKCTAIKEFDYPTGVFLIVDSNFMPPSLSKWN